MPRHDSAQLTIRSAFARMRAHEIARRTGMTATEVIEDALRGYVPAAGPAPGGALEARGRMLVRPVVAGRRVSQAQADAALEEARNRDS